ncbi:DUF4838 domain-containing protein [Paenibacillus contaminans]|nr:DUF4838 domain-containing protein [Paenibacillus contaminans]
MRRKLIWMMVFLITLTPLLVITDRAEANQAGSAAAEKVSAAEERLQQYEASGDVQKPLAKQLGNALKQVRHHLDKGSVTQALKKMEDFIKHLENDALQKFISEAAKNQLEADANLIIQALNPSQPEPLSIVKEGGANAVIIIAEDANNQTVKAASTLAEYVKKSTGAQLSVQEIGVADIPQGMIPIYVGIVRPESQSRINGLLSGLQDDGYVIDPYENTITIIGPKTSGTAFGVYEFLERYVGVRWLLPGTDGEDVPRLSAIAISANTIIDEPATISRHFFGTESPPAVAEWANRNRMHDNIQFHHNMSNLFDPKVFADHPEYYAGGVVPTHPYSWQPCFNDTTAEAAVRRIIEFFDANPEAASYSLGINDGVDYCESDPSSPDYPTKKNSVGAWHRSDVYYPWVNKIVEGVLEKHPDKYFGLLAYREMYDPPTNVTLNPHVIPYITDDRMSWIDPPMGNAGASHTENWQNAATNLGWYEYLYGSPYSVPRVYPHQMAENYKYANEHGVIGHVAELYPNFGEGPKPWVSAKLQWDPEQDVDALLGEWYERAVGAQAAPYLQQYYEYWEQFWTTRIFESDWYLEWANRPNRTNYLNLFDQSYLKAVTKEDIAESRRLLELAAANAVTDPQKTRAGLLLRSFEYYEASALSYPRSEAVTAPASEQEATAMLDDVIESFEMAKKRMTLLEQFKGNPALDFPLRPPAYGGVWDGIQRTQIYALQSYADSEPENGNVRERLRQFLAQLPEFYHLSAYAVKTDASKEDILQSLDFSAGPWTDAEPFSDFLVMNSKQEAPVETKVYLLWDDENLYVGYENFDGDPSKMIASDDAPNGWWSSGGDDSVETYVTADSEGPFTGFFTNPKSVSFIYNKTPVSGPTPGTDPNWEANANVGSDRWNVVQAIPFSSIGADPSETRTLKGFFFRNYHGQSVFLGWGGGAPWKPYDFNPVHLVETKNRVQNPSFEAGNETNVPPWKFSGLNPAAQQIMKQTDETARTGSYSLETSGLVQGAGPYQEIAAAPGKYKAVLSYYTPETSTTEGTIQWWNNIKDREGGTTLQSVTSLERPVSWTKGQWSTLAFTFEIKSDYGGTVPEHLQLCVTLWGFQPGEQLFIDDVALYKLE